MTKNNHTCLGKRWKKKPITMIRMKRTFKKLGIGRGEKSNFWAGGKSLEKYDKKWMYNEGKIIRENIRKRDKYICQFCGINQNKLDNGQLKKLDVHHIDYDKYNHNYNNLITLCRSCHLKTNFDRKVWISYFNV